MNVKTEFTTFRVLEGKEELAVEWMDTISNRRKECVETLDREKMLLESVFSLYKDGRMYLSWFTVQKEGYKDVETSDHDIDKVHLKYWEECIDESYQPLDHAHVVTFFPEEVESVISKLYE
jgi:hypothetical protein